MSKMRLRWYAGASTALATSCVLSAFFQRPNFYSAMVYLAQSNFCMLVLFNFTMFLYGSFFYGVTRVCFGRLRTIEVEQLTERAWFAVTETCLAMTIFREEIGAWFLVMFAALVTGKVWGWIADGRVEVLEQQPPANPRLFHTRLSISLAISLIYDLYIFKYAVSTVIQQARPNMMVMFLFEFAVLSTTSLRSSVRYLLTLAEQNMIKTQTRKRLEERRKEVREERERIQRQREAAAAAGESVPENQEPLPSEDDIDEMDIEVPGWAAKGEWVLWIDLISDTIKLGIYIAFFLMLLIFYGLPIHIMRDLFVSLRDFLKRATALTRYRRAIREMNQYPDATEEELARENTCIICREEMRPWDPASNPGAVDRVRPKKLPCGHTLHLGCLRSWLERQQVCPTCRSPVTGPRNPPVGDNQNRPAAFRIQIGGGGGAAAGGQGANGQAGEQAAAGQRPAGQQQDQAQQGNAGRGREAGAAPRVFQFGPFRVGIGAGDQQVRQLAQDFGVPAPGVNQPGIQNQPNAGPAVTPGVPSAQSDLDHLREAGGLLARVETVLQSEVNALRNRQQELQTAQLLLAELHRLRQREQQPFQPGDLVSGQATNGWMNSQGHPSTAAQQPLNQLPGQMPFPHAPGIPGLPQIPQRVSSPMLTRHIFPTNGTTIASGSADLPDGVVIPPGWSLMPLQRLDGTQHQQTQQPPQNPASVSPAGDGTPVEQPEPTPTTTLASNGTSTDGNGSLSTPHTSSEAHASRTESQPEMPNSSSIGTSAPIAAPSPRAPNWGGSAQRFSATPGSQAAESTLANDAASDQAIDAAGDPSGSKDDEEHDSSTAKGKGKAVYVEEAEDGDS